MPRDLSSTIRQRRQVPEFYFFFQSPISETRVPIPAKQTTVDFALAKFEIDAIASLVEICHFAFGGTDGTEGFLQVGKHSCILSLGAAGIILVPAFVSLLLRLLR